MDIQKIKVDGFYVNKTNNNIENIAFLSLNLSLKSYFSTYRSIDYCFSSIANNSMTGKSKDNLYTHKYVEAACEAISHFQHFTELIVKDILRKAHPLLSIDASKNHNLLYDLIVNKSFNEIENQETKEIEFSVALERIVELIKSNKIDKIKYGFIAESKSWLEVVNKLRNRIAHRGIFVIRYEALDFLFGEYILPFTKKVFLLKEYEGMELINYKNNAANINPIEEIINHINNETYSINKISLLKEIGRASIENPIYLDCNFLAHHNKEIRRRYELLSKNITKFESINKVVMCPICNTISLVKYEDFYDDTDEETGITNESYRYIYNVKCFCCSFDVDNHIHDIEKMNLNIENFWEIKE